MKMSDTDLLRFLDTEQQAAYQHQNTNLSPDRVRATKEYLRSPYGNEEEGGPCPTHSGRNQSDPF